MVTLTALRYYRTFGTRLVDILIRPARPEDAEAAVPLIYSSGPAAFDYVFTHQTHLPATGYLRRALEYPNGEFGYRHHVVVELDGEVVGAGASFSGRDALGFMPTALRQIFGWYGLIGGARVSRRGLQVERVVQVPKGDLHYISHLGVSPELRGHGIGRKLVDHLIELGRAKGRTLAALDVSVENPRAQALYERIGFTVTSELVSKLDNDTARVPNHRRMEVRL